MSRWLFAIIFLFGVVVAVSPEEAVSPVKENEVKIERVEIATDRAPVKRNAEVDESIKDLERRLEKAPLSEREQISKEIHVKKEERELTILKRRIESARKSGDPERIKEAEIALDKYLHPEKYMPEVKPVKREMPKTIEKKYSKEKESK